MRIAVSGISGFIGGNVHRLLAVNNDVVGVGRRENCAIQMDFSKPESIANVDLHGFDAIVHCAGIVDEDFQTNPATAYVQSTLGISAFVRKAVECGVRRFVYFSTSHVYGSLAGYITEENRANPLSDYAIAHYAAEQVIRRHTSNTGLTALVLRPNTVYGMPANVQTFDRWHLIPYSFPQEAVYKQRITLRTAGNQRRNFIDVSDLVGYAKRFLVSEISNTPFMVVNPVGLETLSVYQFAIKCSEIYTDLTKEKCIVVRSDSAAAEEGSDFVYGSIDSYHQSVLTLNNFLVSFMRRILRDREAGRKQ